MTPQCNWVWGSHSCDLDMGHPGVHACDGCSQFDSDRKVLRYWLLEDNDNEDGPGWWGEWNDFPYGYSLEFSNG